MQYIVTGGAGFIGSNLTEKLLEQGHKVFVIDNMSTGSIKNIPKSASLYQGSYKEVLPVFAPVYDYKMDGIFHLGMPSSIPPYRKDRLLVSKTLEEFTHILEVAKEKSVKIVFASTSNIYNGNLVPWKEDMPIYPTDFYSDARHYIERLSFLYNEFYGVNSIGLRLFANYGPREEAKKTWASIISQLTWAKEKGEKFKIYGDGSQSRDYIHVSDTVNAFILAMNSDVECKLFNIGTGIPYSFNNLIEMIGTDVEYVENPVTNYVEHTLADTKLAERLLGFKAEVSLKDGIWMLK